MFIMAVFCGILLNFFGGTAHFRGRIRLSVGIDVTECEEYSQRHRLSSGQR